MTEEHSAVEVVVPAGFWRRVMAHFVDACLVVFVGAVLNQFSQSVDDRIVISIATNGLFLVYKCTMEWRYGWTLGKRAFRVCVVDLHGGRISVGQAVYRQLPFAVLSVFGALNTAHILPALEKATDAATMQAVLENSPYYAGCAAAALIWWLSCLLVAFSRNKRAGHDLLAGTKCIRMPR